jgi:hypothetical protein
LPTDTWQLVIADMEVRRKMGIERYSKPVQPFNGRNSLLDAYQEALDLCVYLRNVIEEQLMTLPKGEDPRQNQ